MDSMMQAQIDQVRAMNAAELRARYGELFGRAPTTNHPDHLVRRIAWKLQALAESDLSERAMLRAAEIAQEVELKGQARFRIARVVTGAETEKRGDPRLPVPGSVLSRVYRDRNIVVKVLADGFECDGQKYSSLSAAARAVTGTRWNGLVFFGCAKRGETAQRQNGDVGRAA